MSMVKSVESAGRKTMLAGAGSVSEGLETAVGKVDNLYEESGSLLQGLISRGEQVEADLKNRFSLGNILQRKVAFVRKTLNISNQPSDRKLEKLSDKVDKLTEVVAKLAEQQRLEQQAAKKRAATAKAKAEKAATAKPRATAKRATKANAAKSTETATKTTAPKPASKPRTRRTTAAKKTTS